MIIIFLLLAPAYLVAEPPGFRYLLESPSGHITGYPAENPKPVVSISFYNIPKLKSLFETPPLTTGSSYKNNTLTFTATYYKKLEFIYAYVPRTVDASAFMRYRLQSNLSRRMSESSARGLSKEQRQKEGGLLSVNIPVKSKAFESIFGEGGAGLKVSGYHQITFSGRSQWDNRASTATYRQNKFPALNMEQISRFDINGTIGTKITVSVSQDSKTDIPLANRIMIRYKGDEDDIIKDIEAGNTTLSLPNTQFVGYSSRIQGLFGLKTSAQIGAVTLTAIASQEKGTTERSTITAGSSASKINIRDYSYINGKIYDLGRQSDFNVGDSITALEVFTARNQYDNDPGVTIQANFYVNPKDTLADTNETAKVQIRSLPVDPNSYYVNVKEHWILFDTPNAGATNEIGVWMVIKRSTGVIDTIGNISDTNNVPYSLKLIKRTLSDSSMVTWNYMWRNVYSLNAQNIDVSGLDIKIYKGLVNTENSGDNLDHQNGPKYIKILGLDVHNADGTGLPDGLTDVKNGNIIDAARGLLIFPDRRPFDPVKNNYDSTGLLVKVPEIYAYSSGTEQPILKGTYYIEISNKSRNSAISLGRANILDGSERITINGKLMERGTDYNIQYDYGSVTFLTDEALDPNANISIEFEYSPYITSEKKTLFGIRSEYAGGQNFKVGSTFLYKSDKATERKPKIGQETAKTMVWDGDISFQVKPNFLSKVANLLPFYSTKNESSLGISAEIAKSFPNPNVDGTAYLDDFEGARDSYSLGVFRENWTLSSKPIGLDGTRLRGRLIWFNPWNQVPTTDIWNKEVDATQQGTHTLWLKYYPTKIDRRAGEVPSDTVNFDPAESWAGVMRYMTAGSANQEQAQLLELRVLGQKGILHIDMGNISEDMNGNGKLDTEDKQENGRYINQITDPGEDIGIDGLKNEDEPGYDREMNPDPNGDDWYYPEGSDDYSHINGTEVNASDPNRSGKPDTEDLYYNGSLDKNNNYYSYKIDLDKGTFLVDSSNYNGWRTFRISIKDTAAMDTIVGAPLWTQINFVRMWVESPNGDSLDIRIAAADLIQSNWNDTLIPGNPLVPTSSRFKVAVVNQQENSNYRPPPGVTGYYDKTSSLTESEQSLLLSYDSLVAGDVGMAERFLYDTPSLVGYRKLHMYVHGPLGVNLMQFFFRVGQDTSNFYEYQTMLTSDWATENNVEIDFNEITALKEYLLQSRMEHPDLPYDTVSNHYRIHGQPNITKIKYLACGVINLDSSGFQSGEVWVDELRVTEVRRDVGTAARASVSGNVADLFSYSGGITYRDSYFRGLSASTRGGSQDNLGSGSSSKSYNYNFYFNLDRFLPRSLGASIPISYRYNQNTEVPLLRFGTDIILPEKLRNQEKTTSISKGLTISESFNKTGKNPLFSLLLNRLKSSFSYSRTESSSPSSPMSFIETYHFGSRYDYNFTNVPSIKLFFWTRPIPLLNKMAGTRFYFLPNNFNTSADLDRTLQISENSSNMRTDNLKRDFRGSYQLSYKISDNLTANYSMETRRDMADPDLVSFRLHPFNLRLGQETDYNQNFSVSYNPAIFSFLTHQVTYGASYRENLNVSDSALNAGSSKSYGINGNLNLKKLVSGAGGSKKARGTRMQEKIAAEEEARTKKKADSGPGPISKTYQFLTGWLNPITYDFNERYNYTFTGLEERAQFKFRMGLSGDVGASQKTNARSSGYSNASSKSTAITLGSGTVFFGGLKTDVTFNRKIDKDIVKSVNPQKTVSTVFPDFRFTIQPLTTIKIFNPLIRRFNPRTGYSKSKGEVFNMQSGFKSTERTTTSQRPLLSINFDILRGMQINFSTDRSVTDENIINSQNGNLTSRTRTTVKNTSISTKYSFSAPSGIKFPLLGKLRIQSTMSIAVDVTMRKTKSESASGTRPLASSGEQSDLLIVPNISYTFSSQIKGSFSARWQDTNNVATQTKSHVRELRITVDIRF